MHTLSAIYQTILSLSPKILRWDVKTKIPTTKYAPLWSVWFCTPSLFNYVYNQKGNTNNNNFSMLQSHTFSASHVISIHKTIQCHKIRFTELVVDKDYNIRAVWIRQAYACKSAISWITILCRATPLERCNKFTWS